MTEMHQIDAFNVERMKITEGLNAYQTLLSTYVQLLGQTWSNLKQLVISLDRPVDVEVAFESTLGLALQAP